MSGKQSSSSSLSPSGSSGRRSSSRSLAARLGLFLVKLLVLVPVCFYLWSFAQPYYGSIISSTTNQLIALEETGERVTRLSAHKETIQVWSTLRDDGKAASGYNADLLHFYLVLCVSLVFALPEPKGLRKLKVLGVALACLVAFHTLALLITVEHTYAVSLQNVAARNYSATEAQVYIWLRETFVEFAIQLIPATLLLTMVVLYGGIGRALSRSIPDVNETDAPGPPELKALPVKGKGKRKGRRPSMLILVPSAGLMILMVSGLTIHMGKVRARQAEAATFRGTTQLEAGGIRQAAVSFQAALKFNPDFAAAHRGLGEARMKLGQPVEAERAFRASAHLEPGNFKTVIGIGTALMEQKRFEDAASYYKQAGDENPARWEPMFNLGQALYQLGRLEEAVDAYNKTIAIYPTFPPAQLEMAKAVNRKDGVCAALPYLESYAVLAAGTDDALKAESMIRSGRLQCP